MANNQNSIESYGFHHIDTSKCRDCTSFDCEEACYLSIYEVINKNSEPKCIVNKELENKCLKCHICTTACKFGAITID